MKLIDVAKLTENLLKEGMDIHAFRKLFPNELKFQRDCDVFASKIQNDRQAREANGLTDLNSFKNDPEGFHKAVQDTLKYIEERKKAKASRKAQKIEGVDIVFENTRCLITAAREAKYARKAGSLLTRENSCPWCIAAPYPDNETHWDNYDVEVALFIYTKNEGELNDAWCMVFTKNNIFRIVEDKVEGIREFSQLESLGNHGEEESAQKAEFTTILRLLVMSSLSFYSILKKYFISKKLGDYIELKYESVFGDDDLGELKTLIEKLGRDIYAKDSYGNTLLHYAARYNSVEIGEWLLNEKHFNPDAYSKGNITPLCYAINYGSVEMIDLLTSKGADVNHVKPYNISGLYEMVNGVYNRNTFPKIASMLVRAGCDPNITSDFDRSPLTIACEKCEEEVAEILINAGADVNYSSKQGLFEGVTPLLSASKRGLEKTVELLVSKGAVDVGRDKELKTAIHYAAKEQMIQKIERVITKENVNLEDNDGCTALIYAFGQEDAVKILIEKGAEYDVQKAFMKVLSTTKNVDGMKFLVKQGADVNATFIINGLDTGLTPLMDCCALNASYDAVKFLIESEADLDKKDKFHNLCALDYAVKYEHYDIVELLLDYGAKIDYKMPDTTLDFLNDKGLMRIYGENVVK